MKTIEAFIEDRFDVKGLKVIGFFSPEADYEQMAKRICDFFGLPNVFMYDFIGPKPKPVKADLGTFSLN